MPRRQRGFDDQTLSGVLCHEKPKPKPLGVSSRLYPAEPRGKKNSETSALCTHRDHWRSTNSFRKHQLLVPSDDEKSTRPPTQPSTTDVPSITVSKAQSTTSLILPENKILQALSTTDDAKLNESSSNFNFEVEGPDDILAKAWTSIGKKPEETGPDIKLDICMMVLPDNLVECVDADLDDALRQQLLGEAYLRQAPPASRQKSKESSTRQARSLKKKPVRNPWYLQPKKWYTGDNSVVSSTEYQSGGLSPEDKANLHICDVYRRYCIKEGKRIPQCLT